MKGGREVRRYGGTEVRRYGGTENDKDLKQNVRASMWCETTGPK